MTQAERKRLRANRVAAGLCYMCGRPLPEGSKSRACTSCRTGAGKIKGRTRYDNHPRVVELCMHCKHRDCIGKCADWQELQAMLAITEPDYVPEIYI